EIHWPCRQADWFWTENTVVPRQFPKVGLARTSPLKQEVVATGHPRAAASGRTGQSGNDFPEAGTIRRHFPDGTCASHGSRGHRESQKLAVWRSAERLDVTGNGQDFPSIRAISVYDEEIVPVAIENGLRSLSPHRISGDHVIDGPGGSPCNGKDPQGTTVGFLLLRNVSRQDQ